MKATIFFVLFLTFLTGGCTKKDEERPPIPKTETLEKAPPSYDFVDKGFKNAEISLEKGTVSITYSYTDKGDFVVMLTRTDNTDSHLIANIKEPKSETVKVEIANAGSYMLNIQTQGSYSISVREIK